MRSTVRIDDDLMQALKEQAERENISQTKMLNRLLRAGIQASKYQTGTNQPFREKTLRMGQPEIKLDKALSFAMELEDAETLKKIALRK